nr:hypothetical protein GCM10025699_17410 [Microbacterium flavescens]
MQGQGFVCAIVLSMGVPAFEPSGLLPHGRFACDLDEFERVFVLEPRFVDSTTRRALFGDFRSALELVQAIAPRGVERVWFGGGFTTSKSDPSDIDATFILNAAIHDTLGDEARERLAALLTHGGFKGLELSVDGFMLVRTEVANPWTGDGGVRPGATPYLVKRGAWDDWWSRHRVHGTATEKPKAEDAPPRRGYVEVIIDA